MTMTNNTNNLPTREQIVNVLSDANVQYQHGAGTGSRSGYLADAVLALIHNTASMPTRDRIAEARQVLYDYADRKIGTDATLIALRALIQNGADRG